MRPASGPTEVGPYCALVDTAVNVIVASRTEAWCSAVNSLTKGGIGPVSAMLAKSTAAMDRLLEEMRGIEGEKNGVYWRYAKASRLIQEARPAQDHDRLAGGDGQAPGCGRNLVAGKLALGDEVVGDRPRLRIRRAMPLARARHFLLCHESSKPSRRGFASGLWRVRALISPDFIH